MTTIAQVAEEMDISAYTIRFYEKEGLLRVPRTESGIRDFDDASVRMIEAIKHFRTAGIPLAKIKEHFDAPEDYDLALRILDESRERLVGEISELQASLEFLDAKAAHIRALASNTELPC